jgi:hypothetical protein
VGIGCAIILVVLRLRLLSRQSFGPQPFQVFAQSDLLLLVFGQGPIRLGDRVFLLSPRPARILAEPPIRTPRNARGQAEIAAIRAGIEYLINDDRAKRNGI